MINWWVAGAAAYVLIGMWVTELCVGEYEKKLTKRQFGWLYIGVTFFWLPLLILGMIVQSLRKGD